MLVQKKCLANNDSHHCVFHIARCYSKRAARASHPPAELVKPTPGRGVAVAPTARTLGPSLVPRRRRKQTPQAIAAATAKRGQRARHGEEIVDIKQRRDAIRVKA